MLALSFTQSIFSSFTSFSSIFFFSPFFFSLFFFFSSIFFSLFSYLFFSSIFYLLFCSLFSSLPISLIVSSLFSLFCWHLTNFEMNNAVRSVVMIFLWFAYISSFRPEIWELQRSINTYNMRYFPQHVLLCTCFVHDQSGDISIQWYFRNLWIGKCKIFKNRRYSYTFYV